MIPTTELVNDIEELVSDFLQCRAMFPHLSSEDVGGNCCEPAPFYQAQGLNIHLSFPRPLTERDVENVNYIGRWINRSFLINLHSLLARSGVAFGSQASDRALDGHTEMDILDGLVRAIVHASGSYRGDDPEHRKVLQRIVDHFDLGDVDPEAADDFPLATDKVVYPLTVGCVRYVRASLRRTAGQAR